MKFVFCILILFLVAWPERTRADDFAAHFHLTTSPQQIAPFVYEDQNGTQHALSDAHGKYVLLTIWATWCAPCVKEMPSLDALQARFDTKKLVVFPVSEDRGDAIVAAFYQTHALRHLPIMIDQSGIAPSALQLHGLPTTLLLDPQGNEIGRLEGSTDWASPDTVAFLKSHII